MALTMHPTFTELPREKRQQEIERGRERYNAQIDVHFAFLDQLHKRKDRVAGTEGTERVHALTDVYLAEEQTNEANRKLTRLRAELEWMIDHE